MSWTGSGTELNQFLRVFLPALTTTIWRSCGRKKTLKVFPAVTLKKLGYTMRCGHFSLNGAIKVSGSCPLGTQFEPTASHIA